MAVLFIAVFTVILQVSFGHYHPDNCNNVQCVPEPFNRTCKPVKAAGKCCPYYFCDDVDPSIGCESKRSQPGCLTPPPNKVDCTAFHDPYGCCNVYQCCQDEKAGVCPREAPISQEEDKRSTWGRLFDSFKNTVNKITRGVKTTLEKHGGAVGKIIAQMIPDPFNPGSVIAVPLMRCTGDYTCPGTMKCCHPLPSHLVQKRRRKRHGKTWIMIHVFVGRQKRSNSALIDGVCVEPEAGSIYPEYTEGPGAESATESTVTPSTGYPTPTTTISQAPVSSVTPNIRNEQGGKVTNATERVQVTEAVTVPTTPGQVVTSSTVNEMTTKAVDEATTAIVTDATTAVTMEATTAAIIRMTTAAVIQTTTAAITEATTAAIIEATTAAITEATTTTTNEISSRAPEDVPTTSSTASTSAQLSTDSQTAHVPTTAAATRYETNSRTKDHTLTPTTPIPAPPPPPAAETTAAQSGTSVAPSVGGQNSATESPKPTTSKPLETTTEDYDHKDTIVLA